MHGKHLQVQEAETCMAHSESSQRTSRPCCIQAVVVPVEIVVVEVMVVEVMLSVGCQ